MSIRNIKIIFLKEMLETIRDKRTLLVMILGPVLIYPILIIASTQMHVMQESRLQRTKTNVHLYEKKEWPHLKKALCDDRNLEIIEAEEPQLDDEKGVLVEFDSRKAKEDSDDVPRIAVTYRQTNVHSERGKERVLAALERYAREVTNRMRVDLAKGERYVYPLILEEKNLSSRPEQVRSVLAMILPMILVLMTIAGAMYPAIDTTAGEKERGTIETILAAPAGRDDIVLGKFLTVFVICMVTGLLNLAAMSLTFIHVLAGFSGSIVSVESVVLVLVSLVPLTVLFSALMMAVSTYARTFREAQNYVTPVYLLCLIPAMVSVQRGFDLNDFLCVIPVINMSLFFKEVMETVYNARHILLVFGSTSVYAALALRAAVKLFHDENALFSLEKPFALFVRRRFLRAKPMPSLSEALFAVAAIFVLYYYVSQFFVAPSGGPSSFVYGTMVSQWLAILLPVILFARYLKLDFRQTFSLRQFNLPRLLGTLLLYCGGFFLLLELAVLQRSFVPVSEEFLEEMSEGVKQAGFLSVVLGMAVTPAICEEMMFRGFVLAGFNRFSPGARILLNGILFGVYHFYIFRMLSATFLGIVIAFIVVYSGSIFLGMLFHLTNNFVLLALADYNQDFAAFMEDIGMGENAAQWLEGKTHLPWQLLTASAVVFIAGALLIWRFRVARRGRATNSEEMHRE